MEEESKIKGKFTKAGKPKKAQPVKVEALHLNAIMIFPNLPSFHAMAIVFSFVGFDDKVQVVLSQLSHKTRSYSLTHKEALQAFPSVWKPEISDILEFGDEEYGYNAVWPDEATLNKLPPNKKIKLKTICYTQWLTCLFMSGIQVEFTHKKKSKMLKASPDAKEDIKKIDIDTGRQIA